MRGYVFSLHCPYDGGLVEHVTNGGSTYEQRAVGKCVECGAEHVVVATLIAGSRHGRRATPAKRAQLADARGKKVCA